MEQITALRAAVAARAAELEAREDTLGRAYLAFRPAYVIRNLRVEVEVATERLEGAEARLEAAEVAAGIRRTA